MKSRLPWVILIIAVAGLVGLSVYYSRQPGQYDDFAKCLGDRGAKFYGAFWCPHCQNQKIMFGKSAKFLPYVECSTPDQKSQLPICNEQNIDGYPTWSFADGSRETGEVSLDRLAEKTGCSFPK